MANVGGGGNFTVSITQVGQIGVAPSTNLPGGVLSLKSKFQNGTGADQFSLLSASTLNFSSATPSNVDLLSLADQVGAPVVFAAVRFLAYRIQSLNPAYTLTAGGAGTGEWNGWLTSGSKVLWYPSTATNDGFTVIQCPNAAGMPVTSSSHILKLDPGSNAIGFVDLIIAGS